VLIPLPLFRAQPRGRPKAARQINVRGSSGANRESGDQARVTTGGYAADVRRHAPRHVARRDECTCEPQARVHE